MGYIAPVDFHQYRQYQNRHISRAKKTNLSLERVFRTEFQEIKREKNDYEFTEIKPVQKLNFYQSEQSKYTETNLDKLSEITGKGQHFSESI